MWLIDENGKDVSDRFIRLSPMIHTDINTPEPVKELLDNLYKLDMDLTNDLEIDLLKQCFENWKKGLIKNQPIEYKVTRENELIYINGFKTFQEAIDKW